MIKKRSNKGFTIIELLIGMVIGMFVLSGATYIYVTIIASSASTLKSSKLNTQMMSMMSIMVNDIRRAGYWATFTETPSANPFSQIDDTAVEIINSMASDTQITLGSNASGQCITYSYDENENGSVDADSEYFGFRLNAGNIEMRTAGTVTDGDSCVNGTWTILSDSDLYTITQLSFNSGDSACVNTREPDELDNDGANGEDDDDERDCYSQVPTAGSGDTTVETRDIEITMTAALVTDPEVTMSISQSVRIRNDWIRIR
ncbi:prepilin-type N-terminal cleavage/methylation domain-containing protein [Thalassotalea litorea]|uniref:prepilin-type N-terminal cleavage/methylation domain-containing protein n=1 Tax=Thalassotalea litorea TaxID=2020715 RepID=UPI003734C427